MLVFIVLCQLLLDAHPALVALVGSVTTLNP